ncbi:hypothetical protein [uncultured Methanobrevibacter sp.]|uniref:hypothetical protein n=1 Tax=uncultured Methanobrevibacter sp. TaxID=253161 RepID=UPI0025E3C7C6|nr:hypothetical protein [uncultured Methanobrevibacter sp.]
MKFKNSYILLIAMAIFLLVSIGSVCASENITTDSDSPLASADTEVALADGEDTGSDATQEKINTTIETVESEEFDYDADKNISVNVKDNESANINVNASDLQVIENGKSLNFTYNNSILSIIDKLSVGNHTLILNYLGNATYANSTTNITLHILGNKTLESPDNIVKTGDEFEIKGIKVFDGVKYLDPLDSTKFIINVTYIDSEGNLTSKNIQYFTYNNGTIRFAYEIIIKSILLNYTDAVNTKTIGVRYATSVNATGGKFKITDYKNITGVHVYDNKHDELTISKNDLRVLENGKEVAFDYNNSVITVKNLAIGVHNLNVLYVGNMTYAPSNRTVTVKVWGNQTFNPDKTANLNSNNDVTITLNLNDGSDPVNVTVGNLTLTLFYKVGNVTENSTIPFTLLEDQQTIKFNIDKVFDSAYVDIKYVAENNLTARTTIKVGTEISIPTSLEQGTEQIANFTTTVIAVNGTNLAINVNNTKVYSNGKEIKFTYNDSVITLTDKFGFGVYNITVKYIGNDTYSEVFKSFNLTVYGINATSTIKVNSTKEGDIELTIVNGTEIVEITADDLTLNVTYKDGNNTVVIPIASKVINNNTLIITLENGNFTSATLNIKYNNATTNVTLNRVYNIKVEAINNVVEYQSGKLTYKITDLDTNEALSNKTVNLEYKITTGAISISGISGSGITIISTISNTTDESGILTFDNNKMNGQGWGFMDVGNHTVTIKSNAFNKTNGTSQIITINKANINIVIDEYKEYYGSDKKIKITVTNAATGDPVKSTILHLYLPVTTQKDYYFQTNENGTSEINVNGFVGGTYDLTISNNDTKNINSKSVDGSFTILKIPVVINSKDVTVYYNTGTTAKIKVTQNGKPLSGMYVLVTLYATSTKYSNYLFQTNSKGEISFSASLTVGKHKMIINSADNRYDAKQVTPTITVKKATGKFTAKKVTTYYKAGKYFTLKLTNTKKKKPIYDAKVNIKIFISKNRYYNYNGKTGMNGQIKLLLDTLKPGSYKVVISCADKKDYSAKEITSKIVIKKAPAKLTPKKMTAKKGAKKFFQVKVKNKKTKKVIKGVKVKIKVYTGKKAKTFTAKTNAKGIAKISTAKLKVGKHKVVVTSANKYVVAKKAKSTIKIKK